MPITRPRDAGRRMASRSLRILYAALDQSVPGTVGGSVHVQGVAEGLAALGHEVHVAVQPGGQWPPGRVQWHALGPPAGRAQLQATAISCQQAASATIARVPKADREALRKPDERRPEPPMNQRDLAVDEPAHQHLV